MKRVLLYQLDGKLPNLALMRIAARHRLVGDSVELARVGEKDDLESFEPRTGFDVTYASAIFEKSRGFAEKLIDAVPDAIVGGTGWDPAIGLEDVGIEGSECDYSIYPEFSPSIGFTQRGCRMRCDFCVVPKSEGKVREDRSPLEIWRGEPHPRRLLLLDNDFFGQGRWAERLDEIRDGSFEVCLCQGINLRLLEDAQAAALASVKYRSIGFGARRIYGAWDRLRDEKSVFRGIDFLLKHGVKPRELMLYMLIGHGEDLADREHRRRRMREVGVMPYPMPFTRDREILGFHRWIVYGYDKTVPWAEWEAHGYQAHYLHREKRGKPCGCAYCLENRRPRSRAPRRRVLAEVGNRPRKRLAVEVAPGFVWEDPIRGHVVACGDAADRDLVLRLVRDVADGPADLALVDPPYALARDARHLRLEGRKDMHFDETWDRFGDDRDFARFLAAVVDSCVAAAPTGSAWVWTSDWWLSDVKRWLRAAELRVWPTYHWCKPNPAPSIRRANPTSAVEYLAMAGRRGAFFDLAALPKQRNWFVARSDGEFAPAVSPHWVERAVVSQAERVKRGDGKDVNSTQKPLDVVEALVRAGCPEDGLVLDACGGTGTTLVAADRAGRRCVYLDLDPDQVRVAASRLLRDRRER